MSTKDFFASLKKYGAQKGFLKIRKLGLKTTIKYSVNLLSAKKIQAFHIPEQIEVLFVSVDPHSASHSYRVENHISELTNAGIESTWITVDELLRISILPSKLKTIVCWRTALDFNEVHALNSGKHQGVTIIYDTDDLTFDPESYTKDKVAGLQQIPESDADVLATSILKLQQKQIAESDFFIGSTDLLVKKALPIAAKTYLLPNKLPDWMMKQAEFIRETLKKQKVYEKDNFTQFVYPSGSNTHQKDFLTHSKIFLQFLENNPFSSLTILGFIESEELYEAFSSVGDRFKIIEAVPHTELLQKLSEFDVALAPLESNSDFVKAKSAIRFFQAGIIGMPIIASPEPEFDLVIRHKVNGWLAGTEKDWITSMTESMNQELRNSIGNEALNNAIAHQKQVSMAFGKSPIATKVSKSQK